jgi:hypothetical protein
MRPGTAVRQWVRRTHRPTRRPESWPTCRSVQRRIDRPHHRIGVPRAVEERAHTLGPSLWQLHRVVVMRVRNFDVPLLGEPLSKLKNGYDRSQLGVICSILSGRSFRNKSSNDMAFPHPKSRKDKYRNEDKPSSGGVVWNFFKRTINITEYRNAKNEVNRTNNRTFRGITHHLIPFR